MAISTPRVAVFQPIIMLPEAWRVSRFDGIVKAFDQFGRWRRSIDSSSCFLGVFRPFRPCKLAQYVLPIQKNLESCDDFSN